MSISISPSEIYGVPGKRLILNIQLEHPRENWKEIKVSINFNPLIRKDPYEHVINETNEVGFTMLKTEVVLPQILGEYELGRVVINRDGLTITHNLPKVHILTIDGYFEETVAKTLRALGFNAKRWGGPNNPDIEAYHPDFPTQRFQVEVTTERYYDLSKYRNDRGKFDDLKNKFNFKRLLIIPYASSDHISREVMDRLQRTSDPISLICFNDLRKLLNKYRNFHVSKYEVFAILSQTGFIEIK
jgi:hypothetical protein